MANSTKTKNELPKEVLESFNKLKSLMKHGDMAKIAEKIKVKRGNKFSQKGYVSEMFKNPRDVEFFRDVLECGFEVINQRKQNDLKINKQYESL